MNHLSPLVTLALTVLGLLAALLVNEVKAGRVRNQHRRHPGSTASCRAREQEL